MRCRFRAVCSAYPGRAALIDREAGKAMLCTEPAGDTYASRIPYDMPGKVPLPEPLGFDLDTSEF